jgi:hypothetical protein
MASSTNPDSPKHERRHLRYAVSWSATVQVGPGQSLPVRVIDVSPQGIGVVSDNVLPGAGVLSIVLRVPAPGNPGQIGALSVQARIVHQLFAGGRNRAGLEFVQIADADAELLVRCAQKRV